MHTHIYRYQWESKWIRWPSADHLAEDGGSMHPCASDQWSLLCIS